MAHDTQTQGFTLETQNWGKPTTMELHHSDIILHHI